MDILQLLRKIEGKTFKGYAADSYTVKQQKYKGKRKSTRSAANIRNSQYIIKILRLPKNEMLLHNFDCLRPTTSDQTRTKLGFPQM